MSGTDSPADSERESGTGERTRLRRLAGALGAVGGLALAGCSSGGGSDDGPAGTPTPTATPGSGSGGERGSAGGAGGASDSGSETTPTPTPSMSKAECESKLQAARERLTETEDRLEAVSSRVETLGRRAENFDEVVDLFRTPPAEEQRTAKAVGKEARDGVVFLELGRGTSATGWYVDDHHVVTNAHNVSRGGGTVSDITVWTFGGSNRDATVVDFVDSLIPDIAVLRTDEAAPATLPLGTSEPVSNGDTLVQVGHPGGIGHWVLSAGSMHRVSTTRARDGSTHRELETTVPGRPGVSGSPLLDLEGTVVGLTNAGSPVKSTPKGEAPIPAKPTVYDRPIASLSYGEHVAGEVVREYYERWV